MSLDKPPEVSRRKALKSASAAGILGVFPSNVLAKNTPSLVKYVHRTKILNGGSDDPKKVPIYETMEQEEWNRRSAGAKAASKIYEKIDKYWEPTLIRPYFRKMDDSPVKFGVNVDYHKIKKTNGDVKSPPPSRNQVEEKLPDRVNVEYNNNNYTINVKLTESIHSRVNGDCGRNTKNMCCETWDSIPGGTPCRNKDSGGKGSFCARFWEYNYSAGGLIMSGHVASELRADITQNGTYVADVFDITNNQEGFDSGVDWAWVRIRKREGYDVNGEIAEPQNNPPETEHPVSGIVNNSGLMGDAGTDQTYYTQGRNSRRLSGTINELGGNDNYSLNGYNDVKSSHDVGPGDSGGPLFMVDSSGDAYIAGVMYASYDPEAIYRGFGDGCGGCLSTTAETVEDDAPGYFY